MCTTELDRFYRKVQFELAESTLSSYQTTIKQFFDFVKKRKGILEIENVDEFLREITTNDVEDYRFFLIEEDENGERKYRIDSANTKFYALKSLFSYLGTKEGFTNPIEKMTKLKPNEKILEQEMETKDEKEVPSLKEIKDMIKQTYIKEKGDRNFSFNSVRNRFMIAFLASTGMRIEELLNIDLDKDIFKTEEGYEVRLKSSKIKNKLKKNLPITHHNLNYFEEYLKEREKINVETNYLIISKNGKKLGRDASNEMIKKYMKKIGSDKKITNHSFRHSANSFLRANGVSDAVIKSILGWKEKDMSGTVYNHETEELRLKKIEACASVLM